MGQALSEQMGQPFVVENRPGGDSAIAAEAVTRMAADGYTIFFASNSAMTAGVALRKSPAYDPLKDFTSISMVGRATNFFYMHPSVPATTLKEFIAHARANPGKLNYGTGNPLTILSMAQLTGAAGLDMLHVPYKGEGPLTPDFLAGRIQVAFMSNPAGISLAKEGKLRVLAVLLDRRSPLLPDVPTIDEAGVPQVTVRQWAGVFGPPKMPRDIVERLNKAAELRLRRRGLDARAPPGDQPRRPRAVAQAGEGSGHRAGIKKRPPGGGLLGVSRLPREGEAEGSGGPHCGRPPRRCLSPAPAFACRRSATRKPEQIGVRARVRRGEACTLRAPPIRKAPMTQPTDFIPAGVVKEDLVVGTGASAAAGQDIVVHYIGWLESGQQFDSSRARRDPLDFALGAGDVIKGWDQGVPGMKVGGMRKLTIPPELAYGDKGCGGVIPPNATLVFDVELLEVA